MVLRSGYSAVRAFSVRRRGVVLAVLAVALGANVVSASTTMTRSKAAAIAHAINLRKSDLPGFTEKQSTTQGQNSIPGLQECLHRPSAGDVLAGASSDFSGPGIDGTPKLTSNVAVWSSAALLDDRLKAITGRQTPACLGDAFDSYLRAREPKGVTYAGHLETLAPPVHGSDGAFGFRFVLTVHAKPGSAEATIRQHATATTGSVYVDLSGFLYRQVALGLLVETIDVPPRLSLEQHLSSLLLARARAES